MEHPSLTEALRWKLSLVGNGDAHLLLPALRCPIKRNMRRERFLLYSLYMPPWTLCADWACNHVPCLRDLDVVPPEHMGSKLREVLQSASLDISRGVPEIRNHELSWRCYIRGHVVVGARGDSSAIVRLQHN